MDRARDRKLPETLGYNGFEGAEVTGDWSQKGAIVSVLVRKATGGTKGITRGLAALVPSDTPGRMRVADASALVNISPIIAPGAGGGPVDKPPTTHVDLGLPFNLSLTDEQRRRRGEVPLPYAHEGEGVGIEYGDADEEDEDED